MPTDDEWRRLARHYGGVLEDSDDGGKAAYMNLSMGGSSGFNALLGGALVPWFYNFGKGGSALNRHREGDKQMAASVRCIEE